MSENKKCCAKTVFDPPQAIYEDYYHPQHVEVVQQIEVIRRHHCVPVYHHVTTCTVKDVFCGDSWSGEQGNEVRTSNVRKKRK
ncbi:hypothetical protein [Cohnella abietis]|uniref:Uncharacterized protein n=1 Tax=Cohnella abietis TaxID=2507935 RepID=A0A3T1D4M6_9BACL|nr:hypothetical protein [Cohnella abietis]BBI33047.1 hypothetical protein KCTCHS21_24460 [Cohnella abietis]